MSDKIINLKTKRQIGLKPAVNKYGITDVKDPTKFKIPDGKVAVFDKNRYKLLTRQKVSSLLNKGFNPVNIIGGDFVINTKNNLVKPKISEKQEKVILRNTISHVLTPEDKQNPFFMLNFLRDNNIRGTGKIIFTQNGRVIYEEELDIGQSRNRWFKEGGMYTGMVDSDKYVWFSTNRQKETNYGGIKYLGTIEIKKGIPTLNETADPKIRKDVFNERTIAIWSPNVNVDLKKINQVFRENQTNTCFFDNALQILQTKKETKLQKDCISKLTKLREVYKDGVSEDDIQTIVNSMRINVYITDAINNQYRKFKCNKKDFISINLINNRCNHLEKNEFVDYNSNVIEIASQEKMQEIYLEHIGKQFYYIGSLNNILSIYTPLGTYTYKNLDNEKIQEFNKEIGIYNYSLDLCNTSDYEKYKFVMMGVNYNSHVLINDDCNCDDTIEYKEFDMKNAYIRYKKNKHYVGFCNILSHVVKVPQDWDIEKYVGYYRVYITNFENENTELIFNALGMERNKYYTLSSIMLLHFKDWSIQYKLLSGCYSYKSVDIELTDDIIENKLYCKWTGKLNSVNRTNSINLLGSLETAEVLRQQYDNVSCNKYFNTNYEESTKKIDSIDDDLQEIKIQFDKKSINYLGHVGGFICDYTRSTVIDKLLIYKFDDIIGYKLDGFIIKNNYETETVFVNHKTPEHHLDKCVHDENSIWTLKKVKYTFDWGYKLFDNMGEYDGVEEDMNNTGIDSYKYQHELITGVGGAGKTTSIFCDDYGLGWKDALFVAGNWRLITSKINEYDIKGITIHQLIGESCEPYGLSNKHPAKIIYDECNTYTKEWIQKAFELYPNSQHILLGDMEIINDKLHYYQLSGKDVNVIDIDFFKKNHLHIQHNPNNFRCKEEKLLEILNETRRLQHRPMDETITYITEKFGITHLDELKKNYDYKKDWVLCSTTNKDLKEKPQTQFYTELLQGKKYLITRHSAIDVKKRLDGLDATLKGEIIIDPEKVLEKHENRDAFTIHSFQGLTVSKEETLYIDIQRLFDIRQIYTALSRVQYLNQIRLLAPN